MTHTQYLALKEELKELAQKIRNEKNTRKSTAQTFSKFQRENHTFNDFYYRRISDAEWLPIEKEFWELYKKQLASAESVDIMRRDYRLKHVIYCLARGRTLKEIEPHNRTGNHLDIISISRTAKKYGLEWPPADDDKA